MARVHLRVDPAREGVGQRGHVAQLVAPTIHKLGHRELSTETSAMVFAVVPTGAGRVQTQPVWCIRVAPHECRSG
jgi:hypothetical protein